MVIGKSGRDGGDGDDDSDYSKKQGRMMFNSLIFIECILQTITFIFEIVLRLGRWVVTVQV